MPPPPDRGRRAASGRASLSSRLSRAPLLPQSQSSSKSRTSSPATAISQSNPNAPNPKPLTTLLPQPLLSTPAIPSRPAKAPSYRVQLKTIDLAKPTYKQKKFEITFPHTNINKPNTHQTHSPHTKSTHSSIGQNKKFGDILTQSLKLNFNIDTTFPDRDSIAIFKFYYKTNLQQPQMTQTAPQEHTIDQTMDTAMNETDAATYTEIRQKRRISDGLEDSKLLMNNKYTTYVKLYRNYEDSSPIPDNPTKEWFAYELDKNQDNDKGLKLFTQELDHQPVVEMFRRKRALFLHTKINIIPHEQFIRLPSSFLVPPTDRPPRHTHSTKHFQSQHLYKNSHHLKKSTHSQQQSKGSRNQSSCLRTGWGSNNIRTNKKCSDSNLKRTPTLYVPARCQYANTTMSRRTQQRTKN
ncbi:hypothetical protein FHG87_011599 [Trinorchestia longiramus]|nr:hypothetical protein FHG87_011599 [Trinorchestia longiramus]